ncbi:alpha/beta hydrolase family protein [Pragia fontium]|nr:alpha/beta fold hydrolase [Pragia fontium]
MKKLEVNDPIDQRPMAAVAFFPSPNSTAMTQIGPYQIEASRSVPIEENRYPLILISHGNMGSMWGHHDLASSLTRQGYIVVSVTHPGDNFQDTRRVGTTSAIYGRPLQISAALTAALKDLELSQHIDPKRIGFIGFSAGGTTGLILAGAKPILSRLEDYCSRRPDDRHVCEAQGRINHDRPELIPTADPRIRSFVLLAPLSVVFPPTELKSIAAPMLIYVGEKDRELSPDENAIALARDIQSDNQLNIIPNAGHFTFLAPCSPQMAREISALCLDNPDVNRLAIHQQINMEIASFLTKTLSQATKN